MNSNEYEKDELKPDPNDVLNEESRAASEPINHQLEPQAGEPALKEEYVVSSKQLPEENHHDDRLNGDIAYDRFSGLYAGFWTRFWAYLLDLIVIGSINRMIINPIFRALDVPLVENGILSPIGIATAIVFYLYFVLMTKFYGQTLGKMVFGLKVVELDGRRLSWGTVIFREWIGRFISATIMVLYVVVAFTKKKQALHDLFADTTVIYEPR